MPAKGYIVVNDLYCKACELCVEDCPQGVLALDMDRMTSRGFHPAYMANLEACTACRICAVVCPDAAITVYRYDRQKAEG